MERKKAARTGKDMATDPENAKQNRDPTGDFCSIIAFALPAC
jgi:hypothetical protein